MMRHSLSIGALLLLAGAGTGCGTAWWENIKKDPSTFVATVEQSVHTFLQTAEIIFRAILPLIGDRAATAEPAYKKAALRVTHALAALEAKMQADASAHQDNPDLSAHMTEVDASVTELEQMLNALRPKTGGPSTLMQDADFEELHAQRMRVTFVRTAR